MSQVEFVLFIVPVHCKVEDKPICLMIETLCFMLGLEFPPTVVINYGYLSLVYNHNNQIFLGPDILREPANLHKGVRNFHLVLENFPDQSLAPDDG